MIPGMTATKDNIKGIAKYLNGIYQYVSYEILNYNPLAEAKYHLVDRESQTVHKRTDAGI